MPRVSLVPFYPGDVVRRAGLDVLRVVALGSFATALTYEVRYGCCGAVGPLNHRGVLRRAEQEARTCPFCDSGAFLALGAFADGPEWPVPESIRADPRRRFDSGRLG